MRAIWTGAISFGLVYFPVKLFNASDEQSLEFNLLRKGDLCPIRYARVCENTGEEVPYEDIVRGYEYEAGRYVILEEEDFRRASVRNTHVIDILSFVDMADVDPKYITKPFFLEPAPGGEKAYALLREALKKSGKAGLARFMLRTREHLGLVTADANVIVLNQMRFATELHQSDELTLPEPGEVSPRELDLAVRLINHLSEPWAPEQIRDTYVEDLQRIIQHKLQGQEIDAEQVEPIPMAASDLFNQLNESIQQAKEKGNRKR